MNTHYKIVSIIFFFLLLLSVGISLSNYYVSLRATQTQIKTQSLPLSVDNIYTEIQKNIIEPSIIASMMSHDTFLVDWLQNNETDTQKIQSYLENIKNKYGTTVAFLVSKNSLNYYTQDGVIKKIKKGERDDEWYYRFKELGENYEINLDWNQHISKNMIMFINYKIFDKEYHFLGATGVGLEISYIDEMLHMFKEKYKLNVSFVSKNGELLLSDYAGYEGVKNIYEIKELALYKSSLLSKTNKMIEYKKNGSAYILNTKFIPEINTFILVEANLDEFTQETKNVFYFNLGISLLLTLFIAVILIVLIKGFHKKLEELAGIDPLTLLDNRRNFSQKLQSAMLLSLRNGQTLSLLFIDIDDFKNINDSLGHKVGDLVLQNFAHILKSHIRQSDLCARLGGEEFVIVFIDATIEDAFMIADNLKERVSRDNTMQLLLTQALTLSAGLTQMRADDTIDTLISRADSGMYKAKEMGKNRIHLL